MGKLYVCMPYEVWSLGAARRRERFRLMGGFGERGAFVRPGPLGPTEPTSENDGHVGATPRCLGSGGACEGCGEPIIHILA